MGIIKNDLYIQRKVIFWFSILGKTQNNGHSSYDSKKENLALWNVENWTQGRGS